MSAPQQAPPTSYVPVVSTREDSRFIVINDNCILTLDAVLSVTGIGKVLSSRGHELYSLYNADGRVVCQFEGTGLMQRTIHQIDEISKKHAGRVRESDGNKARLDALERMVDIVWYTPGMPGANQAEEDFEARRSSLASSRAQQRGSGDREILEDDRETVSRLNVPESPLAPVVPDAEGVDIHRESRAAARDQ